MANGCHARRRLSSVEPPGEIMDGSTLCVMEPAARLTPPLPGGRPGGQHDRDHAGDNKRTQGCHTRPVGSVSEHRAHLRCICDGVRLRAGTEDHRSIGSGRRSRQRARSDVCGRSMPCRCIAGSCPLGTTVSPPWREVTCQPPDILLEQRIEQRSPLEQHRGSLTRSACSRQRQGPRSRSFSSSGTS